MARTISSPPSSRATRRAWLAWIAAVAGSVAGMAWLVAWGVSLVVDPSRFGELWYLAWL